MVYAGFRNKLYWLCDLWFFGGNMALWNRGIYLESGGFPEMVFSAGQRSPIERFQ